MVNTAGRRFASAWNSGLVGLAVGIAAFAAGDWLARPSAAERRAVDAIDAIEADRAELSREVELLRRENERLASELAAINRQIADFEARETAGNR